MADIPVQVIVSAKDTASGVLKDVGKSAQDTSNQMKTLQMAVTAVATGLLAKELTSWISAAATAQREMAVVDNSLKNAAKSMEKSTVIIKGNEKALTDNAKAIGGQIDAKERQIKILELSSGDHKKEIENLEKETNALRLQQLQVESVTVVKDRAVKVVNKNAQSFEELRKITDELSKSYMELGFDDEDVALAFSKDLVVTKDVSEARQVLALSADLARAKNIDLASASQLVTMALSGGGRILKQYGIELDDNATKQDVIRALMEAVGGTAESVKGTFSVSMEKMRVSTENLQEALGGLILPELTAFFNGQLIPATENLRKKFEENTSFANDAKGALLGLVVVVGGALVIAALTAIGLLSPLGLAIVAIAVGAGATAARLKSHWNEVVNATASLRDNVVNFINNMINAIRQKIENFQPRISIGLNLPDIEGTWNNLRQRAHNLGIPGFQTGGIVPGMGAIPAVVHGGEMVLNKSQQARLFAMIGQGSGGTRQENHIEQIIIQQPMDLQTVMRGLSFEMKMR